MTVAELRASADQGCSQENCTEKHRLYLSPRCHEAGPVYAIYESGDLIIVCAACDAEVVTLELGNDDQELPKV